MPVQDISGATSNMLSALRSRMAVNSERKQGIVGGLGALGGGLVKGMNDAAEKQKVQAALAAEGLDPSIADLGPAASITAIMRSREQKSRSAERKEDRVDAMAQKELDRGYEQEQGNALASSLGLPSGTPPAAAPILFRQQEAEAERKRQMEKNRAFGGLVAPGKTLAPGGLLNFVDTPTTQGQITQRFSRDQSGMLGADDLTAALGSLPAKPKPPAPPSWKDTREGITFQTDEDIRKAQATQKPAEPKETPEAREARIFADAKARSSGSAAGKPPAAPRQDTRDSMERLRARISDPTELAQMNLLLKQSEDPFGPEPEVATAFVTKMMAKYPEGAAAPAQGGAPAEDPIDAELRRRGVK